MKKIMYLLLMKKYIQWQLNGKMGMILLNMFPTMTKVLRNKQFLKTRMKLMKIMMIQVMTDITIIMTNMNINNA